MLNGVKQGGILSPVLFCIYFDVLLLKLKNNNVGCHIGNTFVGAVGYADDICLLAPSCNAVRQMLHACESFAKEYQVIFNSSKSYITICDRNNTQILSDFFMHGNKIESVPYVKHLGRSIGKSDSDNIDCGISDLISRTNFVLSKFHMCSSDVKNYLFKSYFGCCLWPLSGKHIDKFYCAWRKCVRRIWKVPYDTHCYLIKYLYGYIDIKFQILLRFCNFYMKMLNHGNIILSMCAKLAAASNSSVGKSRRYLLYILNNDGSILHSHCNMKSVIIDRSVKNVSDNESATGSAPIELCLSRDGVLNIGLEVDEVTQLISVICSTHHDACG